MQKIVLVQDEKEPVEKEVLARLKAVLEKEQIKLEVVSSKDVKDSRVLVCNDSFVDSKQVMKELLKSVEKWELPTDLGPALNKPWYGKFNKKKNKF